MMNLKVAAARLGGKADGNGILAPGPGHSARDLSLRVLFGPQFPEGFWTESFAGDDDLECRDFVRFRLGLPAWKPTQEGEKTEARHQTAQICVVSQSDRIERALRVFKSAIHRGSTIGERYLARRVGRIIEWPSDIRFPPLCRRDVDGRAESHPAIIALLRNTLTNKPQAIQRIFLKPDGGDRLRDAMGKASLGPTAGAVVKLSPNAEVTSGLGICEGVEKSLSLIVLGWRPIWATAGTSGMTTFPVLPGVEALTIFADPDPNGQKAARACAERWANAGRDVQIISPKGRGDWGEALLGDAA